MILAYTLNAAAASLNATLAHYTFGNFVFQRKCVCVRLTREDAAFNTRIATKCVFHY